MLCFNDKMVKALGSRLPRLGSNPREYLWSRYLTFLSPEFFSYKPSKLFFFFFSFLPLKIKMDGYC